MIASLDHTQGLDAAEATRETSNAVAVRRRPIIFATVEGGGITRGTKHARINGG
jgi:hypothetical protein